MRGRGPEHRRGGAPSRVPGRRRGRAGSRRAAPIGAAGRSPGSGVGWGHAVGGRPGQPGGDRPGVGQAQREPLSSAIVWQDRRAESVCADRAESAELVAERTGLVLDPYFSAPKMRWLRDNVTRAGVVTTTDTWLVHQLCGAFVTDASTASRSLLTDLDSVTWDHELSACSDWTRGVPGDRAERRGRRDHVVLGPEVPVAGLIVDQQAALLAEGCLAPGSAKCTYGTGAFLLAQLGTHASRSSRGLSTSVAWTLRGETSYCLDGQVFTAASAVRWAIDLGWFPPRTSWTPWPRPPARQRRRALRPRAGRTGCAVVGREGDGVLHRDDLEPPARTSRPRPAGGHRGPSGGPRRPGRAGLGPAPHPPPGRRWADPVGCPDAGPGRSVPDPDRGLPLRSRDTARAPLPVPGWRWSPAPTSGPRSESGSRSGSTNRAGPRTGRPAIWTPGNARRGRHRTGAPRSRQSEDVRHRRDRGRDRRLRHRPRSRWHSELRSCSSRPGPTSATARAKPTPPSCTPGSTPPLAHWSRDSWPAATTSWATTPLAPASRSSEPGRCWSPGTTRSSTSCRTPGQGRGQRVRRVSAGRRRPGLRAGARPGAGRARRPDGP